MNVPLAGTSTEASPSRRLSGPRPAMVVVLAGIDGAGKSTAARLLAQRLAGSGRRATVAKNPCGRSKMTAWSSRLGLSVPAGLLDAAETSIRCANVLLSHLRARCFSGVVIMDRYLYCQLALKRVRGLGPGRFLPWLLRLLPAPDAVFYFAVPADLALSRIVKRGTDTEDLESLAAFDKGYRELDDFPSFVIIDAGQTSGQIVETVWQELTRSLAPGPPDRPVTPSRWAHKMRHGL